MNIFTNKAFVLSLVSLGFGVIFIIAENTFYQFVDSDGVLHESLFMPLGVMNIAVGVIFLMIFIIQKIRGQRNLTGSKSNQLYFFNSNSLP